MLGKNSDKITRGMRSHRNPANQYVGAGGHGLKAAELHTAKQLGVDPNAFDSKYTFKTWEEKRQPTTFSTFKKIQAELTFLWNETFAQIKKKDKKEETGKKKVEITEVKVPLYEIASHIDNTKRLQDNVNRLRSTVLQWVQDEKRPQRLNYIGEVCVIEEKSRHLGSKLELDLSADDFYTFVVEYEKKASAPITTAEPEPIFRAKDIILVPEPEVVASLSPELDPEDLDFLEELEQQKPEVVVAQAPPELDPEDLDFLEELELNR